MKPREYYYMFNINIYIKNFFNVINSNKIKYNYIIIIIIIIIIINIEDTKKVFF